MSKILSTTAVEYFFPFFDYFKYYSGNFVLTDKNLKYLIISNRIFEILFEDPTGKIRHARRGCWWLSSENSYTESASLSYMVLLCALKRTESPTKHINISGNGRDPGSLRQHVTAAFKTALSKFMTTI